MTKRFVFEHKTGSATFYYYLDRTQPLPEDDLNKTGANLNPFETDWLRFVGVEELYGEKYSQVYPFKWDGTISTSLLPDNFYICGT